MALYLLMRYFCATCYVTGNIDNYSRCRGNKAVSGCTDSFKPLIAV